MNTDEYNEGRRCYHRDKGVYSNPYEKEDARYNEFERGWFQAQKRAPESLQREYEREQERTIEINKRINEKSKSLTKEAYLNRKG